MRLDLPSAVRNPISLIGVAVTTAMAVVFLILLMLEMSGQITNPYFGLLLFIAVPAVFVLGLLMIPIGAWRQRRRIARGRATGDWPVIDLRLPRVRSIILGVTVLTLVNVMIVTLAAYGAVHHMESAEFCGTTCHTTMEPECKACSGVTPSTTNSFTLPLRSSPERAVDNAITAGALPRDLPFARREAVAALKDGYASNAEALAGIEARLRQFYANQSSAQGPALTRTIGGVQEIYGRNVVPAMKVGWATYPNNIGHVFFTGCFRCHDDNHKARDGSVITQDCESCHAMP